jgi:hypothetical protein
MQHFTKCIVLLYEEHRNTLNAKRGTHNAQCLNN